MTPRSRHMANARKQSELEKTFAYQLKVLGITDHVAEYVFAPPRRYRFDFAWPDRKIAVEIDGGIWSGGRHVTGAGAESDAEKYTLAATLGWRVLRGTRSSVESGTLIVALRSTFALDDEAAERNQT